LPWFVLALSGILTFAFWQRWPGINLGFWGDEGWMFGDFVYGKWVAAAKGAFLQENLRFVEVPWEQAVLECATGPSPWKLNGGTI
jgi:hypothetical protein